MEKKPDLLRVLGHYGIDVRDINNNQLILCPVHSEDRASCSVHLEKGLWNCKACLADGDAFTIIMLREGIPSDEFGRVIAFAEEHFGYEREERSPRGRTGFGGRSGPPRRGGYRPAAARRGFSRAG